MQYLRRVVALFNTSGLQDTF